MEYQQALAIAESILERIAPGCERKEIAGSLRRRKPEVKDIEIVCLPRYRTAYDMFGDPMGRESLLDPIADTLGTPEVYGDKYKRIVLPEGIKLDLFICTPPAQWGAELVIRTGSADFSHWLVKPKRYGGAMPGHLRQKDLALWNGTKLVPTPEERDYFAALGVSWIEPENRNQPPLP